MASLGQPCSTREKDNLLASSQHVEHDLIPVDTNLSIRRQGHQISRQSGQAVTLLVVHIQQPNTCAKPREGRATDEAQSHGDWFTSVVTPHEGTVIETARDGSLTAAFPDPYAAVQAAIAMQRAWRDHHRRRLLTAQAHIRIGIHTGPRLDVTHGTALGESADEMAQVAAQIESRARPEQVLISRAVYEQLPDAVPCRRYRTVDMDGSPITLYAVQWDERQTDLEAPTATDMSQAELQRTVFQPTRRRPIVAIGLAAIVLLGLVLRLTVFGPLGGGGIPRCVPVG